MFKFDWIVPNVLAAGPIPSSIAEINKLHAEGIRAIISLTEHPLTALRAFRLSYSPRLASRPITRLSRTSARRASYKPTPL